MSRTALIFDDRMDQHFCPWDTAHPECPERFTESMQRIREYGLEKRCKVLKPRDATEEELRGIHSQKHIDELKDLKACKDYERMEQIFSKYDSVYANEHTFDVALSSAGCTVDLMKEVLNKNVDNGMAIIRPPGHHAMKEEYCGYCLFNNVAIAAKYAVEHMGLERVLIVDWDVHHGQASQFSFYEDPRVLYFSIHRYEHGSFWPELRESNFDYIGSGRGTGFNVNVPLNSTGMENWDYLAIFTQILLPLTAEFRPQLILVSSGFDASLGDPEGEMRLTPAMYAHMTHLLRPYGPLCVILEGGYCIPALTEGVAMVLRALLNDPCPRMLNNVEAYNMPCAIITETIKNVIAAIRPYWNYFIQEPCGNEPLPQIKYLGNLSICKPDTYPTKGYHLVLPEDKKEAALEEQKKLKERTELLIGRDVVVDRADLEDFKNRSCVKSHRFVRVKSLAEAQEVARGPCFILNFMETSTPTFQELTSNLVIYIKKLYLETEHDAMVSMFSLLMPLFFKVYPDWVILYAGKGELSPALKTLYALCCEHFSCEGGLILVNAEPEKFTYPSGELKFCRTTAICNIQEACRSLELQLNQFIGALPIFPRLPNPQVKLE